MGRENAVELARIIGKLEAGKKLSALETLKVLPYLIVKDIDDALEEYEKTGKIKPRKRLRL